eukprot:SM000067S20340  [mRNA]  locus=s67:442838:444149:+ [translate_table: standard]
MAIYFYNYSTFLARPGIYLEDLFVRAPYRGRGCGTALITYLARKAVREDLGRVEWCVLDWNERAMRFYEGMGAVVAKDWRICRLTGEKLAAYGESTAEKAVQM